MRTHAILLFLAMTTMTGCATSVWEMKYGKEKPPISYAFVEDGASLDGIYAWKPDAVAAVSRAAYEPNSEKNSVITLDMPVRDRNGEYVAKKFPLYKRKTCVMSAAAIKERNSEGGLNLTVNAPTGETGGTVGAVSRELQKVTILASTSEAATFLDVAMFGICMVAMNGDLNEQTKELFKHSITEAASIARIREQTKNEIAADKDGVVNIKIAPVTPGKPPAEVADPGVPKAQPKPNTNSAAPAGRETATAVVQPNIYPLAGLEHNSTN